jgi:hypothetical protein
MQTLYCASCRILLGLVFTFLAINTYAQKAELKLVDSSLFVTKLKYYSDEHLHTSAGAIPYSSIYSVRFNSKDRKKAEFFLEMLDSMKIKVMFSDEPVIDKSSKSLASSSKLADSLAQSSQPPGIVASLGLGAGIDYGGFGIRAGLPMTQHLLLFGSVGYALAGAGYNAGLLFIAKPKADVSLTINAMWGYNAVRTGGGASNPDEFFYGPSAGVGVRYLVGKEQTNFFHVSIIYPFRTLDNSYVDPAQVLPILASFGFNFGMAKERK